MLAEFLRGIQDNRYEASAPDLRTMTNGQSTFQHGSTTFVQDWIHIPGTEKEH